MSTDLTVTSLSEAVPKSLKKSVNQELVDKINNLQLDDEFKAQYRENLISYGSVLEQGRWSVEQYCDAVRYISYKVMGDTNIKAYLRTFPQKYSNFKTKGVQDSTIARYVHAYDKSKLVNLVRDQAAIPFYIYNQDYRQKALMTQVDLMLNANSEKVRSDAANSVLTHTKPPETAKVELDITHKEDTSILDLRNAVQELAAQQRTSIAAGSVSTKDIAHSNIITIDADTQEIVD